MTTIEQMITPTEYSVIKIPIGNLTKLYYNREITSESIQDLKESIQHMGLIQPLVVVKSKEQNKFRIISGHRRYLACKELGFKTIDCIEISTQYTERELFEISLVENINRKSLNPIEMAKMFQIYVLSYANPRANQPNYGGQAHLAKILGRTRSYIADHIELLKLTPKIQNLIANGTIGKYIGREIINANLIPKEQDQLVDELVRRKISPNKVKSFILKSDKYHYNYKKPIGFNEVQQKNVQADEEIEYLVQNKKITWIKDRTSTYKYNHIKSTNACYVDTKEILTNTLDKLLDIGEAMKKIDYTKYSDFYKPKVLSRLKIILDDIEI